MELSNEDLEGRILKQQEENHRLRTLNQEQEERIKKLKEDKQSQDERKHPNSLKNKFKLRKKKQIKIRSPSQFKRKSIKQKNKQQELFIDTQITKNILTNDRIKMNKKRGDIISEEK